MPHEFYDMRRYPHGWRLPEYTGADFGSGSSSSSISGSNAASISSSGSGSTSSSISVSGAGAGSGKWVAPSVTAPFARMASKGIPGIRMDTVSAASFRALPPSLAGGCYVVDFGAIIQGGLNFTVEHGGSSRT